jgi:hypothetical protein
MPVTMPRDSDGKMRLGGSNAARLQPHHPVDERGRLHGAPELDPFAEQRIVEKRRVEFSNEKEKRRCRKRSLTATRLRRQDKSRTLLGYRMGRMAKENNLWIQGAQVGTTLLRATTRWKKCAPSNLEAPPPKRDDDLRVRPGRTRAMRPSAPSHSLPSVPSQTFESGFGANMIHWWPDGQATANRAAAQIAH